MALYYLQAAWKLWPCDEPEQIDHLAIPTLNCVALSFEIGFKGLLVAKGKQPDTFQNLYGHNLIKLWKDPDMQSVAAQTKAAAVLWSHPAHWTGEGDNFTRFSNHLQWLNDAFAGKGDLKGRLIFRYPEGEQDEFIPPKFMMQAGDTILGFIEDEVAACS